MAWYKEDTYMDMDSKLIIAIVIAFVIGAIIWIWLDRKGHEGAGLATMFSIVGVTGIVVGVVGVDKMFKTQEERKESVSAQYECIEDKIGDGYEIYVNGIKADANHINIRKYSLSSIDEIDESREIQIAANR